MNDHSGFSALGPIYLNHNSAARVKLSANQSIPSGTETKINFDTVDFDKKGDYDTTNYKFVVSQAGIYLVVLSARMLSLSDGVMVAPYIYKNGAIYSYTQTYTGAAGNYTGVIIEAMELTVGDYIEFYVKHDDSESRDLDYMRSFGLVIRLL